MIDRSATAGLRGEEAQGLVELIVALTVLAIGIGSLLTLLTSSALSLQRSDQKGTALVLAETQIELYRGVVFKDIRLDQTSLNNVANVDPSGYYMGANSSDSSIPVGTASTQLTDTAPGGVTRDCPDGAVPVECMPVQVNVSGPDHRLYRIDTYIHQSNPDGGDTVDSVFVDVRDNANPSKILARSSSTFSSINIANVNGKAIVKLSFSAPKAAITGTPVDLSLLTATLSNGNAETGTLSFFDPAGAVDPVGSLHGLELDPELVCDRGRDKQLPPAARHVHSADRGHVLLVRELFGRFEQQEGVGRLRCLDGAHDSAGIEVVAVVERVHDREHGSHQYGDSRFRDHRVGQRELGHDDRGDHLHGLRSFGERSRRVHDDARRSVGAGRHDHAERKRLVQPQRGLHAGVDRNVLVLRELPG